jgi:hypothetical protein
MRRRRGLARAPVPWRGRGAVAGRMGSGRDARATRIGEVLR